MKSIYKLYFTKKLSLIFISLLLIIPSIKNVRADFTGVSFTNANDFENALGRNTVRFHEYENSNNLLNDFFGKNNEPNETEFNTNFQDLSLQIDSKNLREIYKQKLLEMSSDSSLIQDTNKWNFFNNKI